jgi:hypothetical protein
VPAPACRTCITTTAGSVAATAACRAPSMCFRQHAVGSLCEHSREQQQLVDGLCFQSLQCTQQECSSEHGISSSCCQAESSSFLSSKHQVATHAQTKRARCYCTDMFLVCMQLCLRLSGSRHVVCPPLPLGPPPGEVSLQPLLEVMQPDSLVGLFAAVLLEQRVLLRVSVCFSARVTATMRRAGPSGLSCMVCRRRLPASLPPAT